MKAKTTVIPAPLGYFTCILDVDDGDESEGVFCTKEAVIAFVVYDIDDTREGERPWLCAAPITVSGPLYDNYFLLRPDGCVEFPDHEVFDTLEDAKKQMLYRHAAQIKRREERFRQLEAQGAAK